MRFSSVASQRWALASRLRSGRGTAHRASTSSRNRRGEYFDITFAGEPGEVDLEVIDVRLRDRHLLLLARSAGEKSKFLLGHDERHWFVAAVPEAARGVTGVTMAKQRFTPQQRRSGSWMRLARDPEVYAKGAVRHADHATIVLPTWHLCAHEHGTRRACNAARRVHRLTRWAPWRPPVVPGSSSGQDATL